MSYDMEKSIFWNKKFIPIYFIIGVLYFLLLKLCVETSNTISYLPALVCILIGLSSIIYNLSNR